MENSLNFIFGEIWPTTRSTGTFTQFLSNIKNSIVIAISSNFLCIFINMSVYFSVFILQLCMYLQYSILSVYSSISSHRCVLVIVNQFFLIVSHSLRNFVSSEHLINSTHWTYPLIVLQLILFLKMEGQPLIRGCRMLRSDNTN